MDWESIIITLYARLFLLDTQSLPDQTVDQSEHAGSLREQLNELTKNKHLKTGKTMLVFGNE